ncbi:cellulose biosynthesis protein BcsE [Pseudomonas sp. NW5]|uniref:cellulose biosynthesis protein BcsE n=1 Tax=Pseudomonas sp. NW5 TaxID=2934934 RepID=UPI00201FBA9C|nr:cellulose biosynthesis protein BcsE [Pseudomonas sp. NW5]MCL7462377.1 cellulose biosynthesis protein BcsE [Pseudomonas sp. NW5]
MSGFPLTIPSLRDEWQQLQQGGLYWLNAEQRDTAVQLCSQVLAGLGHAQRVILLDTAAHPERLLERLPTDAGPAEVWPVQIIGRDLRAALQALTRDLQRRGRPHGQLLVLVIPTEAFDAFHDASLQRWCRETRSWLQARDCTLLVLGYGAAHRLSGRLLACSADLDGLVQLYRARGSLQYLLHFWRHSGGVHARNEVALGEEQGQLCARAESVLPADPAAEDLQRCLALRAVLEGAPPLSEHWQLFDEPAELLAVAQQSSAASVILAIDSNDAVATLAEQLYQLRRLRGHALKIVVRELSPCLRYLDEQLLLSCGASLIVPCGTVLARFLTLLDSLQGQVWNRTLPDDFAQALRQLQPPSVRGLLAVEDFCRTVDHLLEQARLAEVSHLLVRLQPVPGLEPAQLIGQCRLRRYGDLACVADGSVYLFLFACRPGMLESALDNIFRLAWRELFVAHALLEDSRTIRRDAQPLPQVLAPHPAPASAQALAQALRPAPMRVTLHGGEDRT